MAVSIPRVTALAMCLVAASCSSAQVTCRSLGLEAGYYTVPLQFSWSGISTDNPNFTKAGCDVPLQGVIISYDTTEKLRQRIADKKLTIGRSSFEGEVNTFVYQTKDGSGSKIFVLRMEFHDAQLSQ